MNRTDAAVWLLVLIWGSNFTVVKAALADFHPLAFNSVRFVIAAGVLLAVLRGTDRGPSFERREWPALIGLGVLGNTAYQVLFIFGIDWTLAGNAALMLATVPVFVALLSAALGHERLPVAGWAGAVLSFMGIVLVVRGGARAVGLAGPTIRGDLTMLAAAFAWSAYTVGSRPLIRRHGVLPVTATTMWIGTVGLVLAAVPALLGQDWEGVRPAAWGGLLYSAILAIAVAYLLWYHAVSELGSTRTAVYSNVIPIVALLVAWAGLGEVPTTLQWAGTAAVVGGVMLARFSGVERPVGTAACPPE